ncbi:hypothetical protein [Prochlorococcus sp. MIT 1341]|uniref:hypothetical protein n=1 Tax=Prochlorococcus sp. MIT 1341 TaxID=3096221 RepID=UPI002A750824|nr:hypothetical protein [Prochlorococcus sp. MIT 1341]
MIALTHIIDFATQLPHPSDIGLVKPLGGLSIVPAIFGLIAIIQVSNFHWYAREKNEPKAGWGLDSGSSLFSYRWKQFVGVQLLAIGIAFSVVIAGPEKIFFPLGLS